jgi:V-type H+-transporting ATPase subunit E
VTNEFERKNKEKLVEKRIHRSTLINKSRMSKMEARNKYTTLSLSAIMKTVSVAQHRILADIVSNPAIYKDLIRKLIVEGLIKLFEEIVVIRFCSLLSRCLKRDEALVESLLPACKQ